MNKQTLYFINLEYLHLMCDGDVEMTRTMIEMLVSELPLEFEKMKILYRESNWPELCSVSHKMKSTLAYIGNESLTSANQEIELICKNNTEKNKIARLLALIQKDIDGVICDLREELKAL